MKKLSFQIFLLILLTTFNVFGNFFVCNNDSSKEDIVKTEIRKPLFFDDLVISFTDSSVICKDSLDVKWKLPIHDPKSNFIISDKQLIYLNTNNDLSLINILTGLNNQSLGLDYSGQAFVQRFTYAGSKDLMVPKQTNSKSALLISFYDGKTICLDLETLQTYWHKDFGDSLINEPQIFGNRILMGTKSGYINNIDASSGVLLWKWKEKENFSISNNKMIHNSTNIFFTDINNNFYSVNLLLGKMDWKNAKDNVSNYFDVTNDGKHILAFDNKNNLLIIATKDGKTTKKSVLDDSLNHILFTKFYDNDILLFSEDAIYKLLTNGKIEVLFRTNDKITSLEFLTINTVVIIYKNGDYSKINLKGNSEKF